MKKLNTKLFIILISCLVLCTESFGQKRINMTKEEYYNTVIAPQRGYSLLKNSPLNDVSSFADRKRSALNIGNVWAIISNAATLGYDRWGLCYEFPARSGITYRWTMAPLIGAMKRDTGTGLITKKFVASGTRGAARFSEEEFQPLPGYDAGIVDEKKNIGIAFSDIPESWPDEWHNGPYEMPKDSSGKFLPPSFPGIVNGTVKAPREAYFVVTDNDAENGNKPAPMGIRIDVWALQYDDILNRNYIVYKQLVRNISDDTLFNVYVGIHDDPDCPEQGSAEWTDDYAALIKIGDDVSGYTATQDSLLWNFTYLWDGDDKAQGFVPKNVGWVGLKFLETPINPSTGQRAGVTTFQVFEYSAAPQNEESEYDQLAAGVMAPANVLPHSGDNTQTPNSYGPDVTYVVASGPFTLAPGEALPFAYATIHGSNRADLFSSAMLCQLLYNANYESAESPPEPNVTAVPGNKKVTLYWDDRSEKGVYRRSDGSVDHINDRLTHTNSFEGYKIFKSTDRGISWGEAILDVNGAMKYWRALKQFDLVNGISGESTHPLGEYFLLGDDTGLQHTFVDNDVNNGYEYWYAVVAYDHDDGVLPPLENSIKSEPEKPGDNTVAVVPFAPPSGYTTGKSNEPHLTQGRCTIESFPVTMVDENKITGDKYRITFDTTSGIKKYSIKNIRTNQFARTADTLKLYTSIGGQDSLGYAPFYLENVSMSMYNELLDNVPTFDGISILVQDTVLGIRNTKIFPPGITALKVHRWELIANGISGLTDDYEIRFGTDSAWTAIKGKQSYYFKAPFQVWNMTRNMQVVGVIDATGDITRADSTTLDFYDEGISIVNLNYADTATSVNDTATWNFSFGSAFQRGLKAKGSDYNYKIIFDTNSALPSSMPVQVQITTNHLIGNQDEYEFATRKATSATMTKKNLEDITVVPNPYIVSSPYEILKFGIERELQFHHLPPEDCTIRIFNVAGDLIQTLHHTNRTPIERWNLKTVNDQEVSFGVYIFHVQSSLGEYIGKFAVIK